MRFRACRGYGSPAVTCGRWRPRRWTTRRHKGMTARRALSAYLGVSRGIDCSAGQIFITAGYRGALDLICRTLLRPGDAGWFEDPGYIHARRVLEHAGCGSCPCRSTTTACAWKRAAPGGRCAFCRGDADPSKPARCRAVAAKASGLAGLVSSGPGSSRTITTASSATTAARCPRSRAWIATSACFTGSFSKVLYPGLRLGYLVVPEEQVAAFRDTAGWLGGSGQMLMQSVVADFMEQGHFARHLKKMRALYATRREWLIDALGKVFGDALHVPPRGRPACGGLLAHGGRRSSRRTHGRPAGLVRSAAERLARAAGCRRACCSASRT